MANVAFLGAGLIGSGLVEAAARRGDSVAVWNRTESKARALEAFGVRVATVPAEAVRGAERIHVALSDDAAVDAVLAACGDAIGSVVVVDHTTTSPAGTTERAARLAAAGVAFLHAPVFMSPKVCREAGGAMLAAGPRATFERVEADLARMTGKLVFLGERADLAAAYKLFGNTIILTLVGGLSDVFTLAASLGISPPAAHEVFSLFNPTGTLTHRGAAMAQGDYRPSFELSIARKDLRLMIEVAAASSRDLTVVPALAERMDELLSRGLGGEDVGVMAIDAVPRATGESA